MLQEDTGHRFGRAKLASLGLASLAAAYVWLGAPASDALPFFSVRDVALEMKVRSLQHPFCHEGHFGNAYKDAACTQALCTVTDVQHVRLLREMSSTHIFETTDGQC